MFVLTGAHWGHKTNRAGVGAKGKKERRNVKLQKTDVKHRDGMERITVFLTTDIIAGFQLLVNHTGSPHDKYWRMMMMMMMMMTIKIKTERGGGGEEEKEDV